MIKHFCDQCGVELGEHNDCRPLRRLVTAPTEFGRLSGEWRNIAFCVHTGNAETKTWNSGDFCRYCVIDAINTLDDRPRAAE